MPPKTIAPCLPLPRGRAVVHAVAGWRYQRVRGSAGATASPLSSPAKGARLEAARVDSAATALSTAQARRKRRRALETCNIRGLLQGVLSLTELTTEYSVQFEIHFPVFGDGFEFRHCKIG